MRKQNVVTVLAPAKLNLALDVVGLLPNGYHDLDMTMQAITLYERVVLRRSPYLNLRRPGSLVAPNNKNTAIKAALAFFDYTGLLAGVDITIYKNTPVRAGMAGGSADAAADLVGMNELYGAHCSMSELCALGAKIGADVPFCIVGGTCLAQGIGEVLSPLKPMPSCHIVLAKPDFGVNTGKAYGLFDTNGKTHNADQLGMLTAVQNRDLPAICGKLENVFEQFVEVPGRIEMKEVLRAAGAAGVCMSGSGPTLFGIFTDKAQGLAAAQALAPFAKDIAVTKPVRQGCKIVEVISDCG